MSDRRMSGWVLGLVTVLISLLAGCGSGTTGGERPLQLAKLNGVEYGLLEPGNLQTSETALSGTGAIIVRQPRPEEDSNFALSFVLLSGGEVTLVANANNQLQAGVSITFFRKPDNDLGVKLVDGDKSYDLSEDYVGQKADALVNLSVDVHGHGHVIVFKDGGENEYAFDLRPKNLLWGLRLKDAIVSSISSGPAKEEH